MRRFDLLFSVLLCAGVSGSARADSLDTFTLTGDGHTFRFQAPATETVVDHPQIVDVGLSSVSATVDGIGGYTVGAAVGTTLSSTPTILLSVDPLPPGTTANPMYGSEYMLYAPLITNLLSDIPNPDPCSLFCPNDLLTFGYIPNTYSFSGYDPEHTLGTYTLEISASPAIAATPEPAPWFLLLTGVATLALLLARRAEIEAHPGA